MDRALQFLPTPLSSFSFSAHGLLLLQGSAKRLIKAALQEAAKKREMRYSDLKKIDKKVRRHFHDDITVIVLFLNHDLISRVTVQDPPLSIRSDLEHL